MTTIEFIKNKELFLLFISCRHRKKHNINPFILNLNLNCTFSIDNFIPNYFCYMYYFAPFFFVFFHLKHRLIASFLLALLYQTRKYFCGGVRKRFIAANQQQKFCFSFFSIFCSQSAFQNKQKQIKMFLKWKLNKTRKERKFCVFVN